MYDHYCVTDFVLEEDFQQWVRSPTPATDAYWREVQLLYPHQEENIEVARKILVSMKFRPIPEENIRSEAMLTKILSKIDEHEHYPPPSSAPVAPLARWQFASPGLRVAASVLLLLGVVLFYHVLQRSQSTHISTAYGETKTITLPDGSQVALNGNSTIRYAAHWTPTSAREVWLEGEAYFEVVKLTSDSLGTSGLRKFWVHTRNMDIEVLGTAFNVHQWRETSQVVLAEGSVKVNLKQYREAQEIYLQPGELLTYSPKEQDVVHKVVNPASYLRWQQRQLVFDGESLEEVAVKLQDIFGYRVVFKDPAIAQYQFRGIVPFDDLDVLIFTLRQAYGIDIEKENNTLTFDKK